LEVEAPVTCRDGASFDFHATLASMLGPTLILIPSPVTKR
jgi:hypothetical protein